MTATGGGGDRQALERLLGVPEIAWVVARVRARIPAADGQPLRGVVRLDAPTDNQRAAVLRLVGRSRRAGAALRVDLADVEEVLRRGPWPAGLADAVVTLSGPVVDRRALRDQEAAAWDAARDALTPALTRFPRLLRWWEDWCAAGGLKRLAAAEAARLSVPRSPEVGADLVTRVVAVLNRLPANGQPLAVLARQVLGDAHGLDASRPLGRLAAAVVRVAFTDGAGAEGSSRDSWAAAGVVMSNVASTVLCLGVGGRGADGSEPDAHTTRMATAASLEAMRSARMPLLLTLDQVRSGGARPAAPGTPIYVCENPTIVEVVAHRWASTKAAGETSGNKGPVLVCTSGQPSAAVVELLRALVTEGARLRYHGDFDWAGLRIARSLGGQVSWDPWRYTAADYLAAVQDGNPSRLLTGSPAPSPWDPALASAMAGRGLAVDEEAVADLLAIDVLES